MSTTMHDLLTCDIAALNALLRGEMAAVETYESGLFARLLGGLAELDRVTLYGKAARRAPKPLGISPLIRLGMGIDL